MRIVRSIIAALLALSFVAVPMAAAKATPHAAKVEMTVSAPGDDDYPCCDTAHKCASDSCILKCQMGPALFIAHASTVQPLTQVFALMGAARLSTFAARPELPPPRS